MINSLSNLCIYNLVFYLYPLIEIVNRPININLPLSPFKSNLKSMTILQLTKCNTSLIIITYKHYVNPNNSLFNLNITVFLEISMYILPTNNNNTL